MLAGYFVQHSMYISIFANTTRVGGGPKIAARGARAARPQGATIGLRVTFRLPMKPSAPLRGAQVGGRGGALLPLLALGACSAAGAGARPLQTPAAAVPPLPGAALAARLASQTWQHIPGPTPILHTDPCAARPGPRCLPPASACDSC